PHRGAPLRLRRRLAAREDPAGGREYLVSVDRAGEGAVAECGKRFRAACHLFALGCLFVLCLHAKAAFGVGVTRRTTPWEGQSRSFYLYVPPPSPGKLLPLVLLLHGSGRDGSSLMKSWAELGASEGVFLVAPDSANPAGWSMFTDGPDFMFELMKWLGPR